MLMPGSFLLNVTEVEWGCDILEREESESASSMVKREKACGFFGGKRGGEARGKWTKRKNTARIGEE